MGDGVSHVITVGDDQQFTNVDAGVLASVTTANDESFTYDESETSGTHDGFNLLDNDTNSESLGLIVSQVNGADIGSGAWIDLDKGRVFVSEDGSVDFDAQGDFDALVTGESENCFF